MYGAPHCATSSNLLLLHPSLVQILSLGPCTLQHTKCFTVGVVSPHPTPKVKGHPLSAVRDYLLNIFAATLQIWRPCLSTTWIHAMPCWLGTHLTRSRHSLCHSISDEVKFNAFSQLAVKCRLCNWTEIIDEPTWFAVGNSRIRINNESRLSCVMFFVMFLKHVPAT
jgi:hypothetical protein